MKYFAKLDDTNKVINVHCVNDTDAPTEQDGVNFLIALHNHQYWKQTVKDADGGTRINPAVIGSEYNSAKDVFIFEKPHPSWILNEDTWQWKAPTPMPDDGKRYNWNEDTQAWDKIPEYSG